MDEKLASLTRPESVLVCRNVHCKEEIHRRDADCLMIAILELLEQASYESPPLTQGKLPHSTNGRKTTTPVGQNMSNRSEIKLYSGNTSGNLPVSQKIVN